jgi:hypothetical protein
MTRRPINTPGGDRRRDRAARAKRTAQPLDGNRIRVRAKRLDQVNVEKLTLAYWLLAKEIVSDQTDGRELTEKEVRATADRLEDESDGQAGTGEARS